MILTTSNINVDYLENKISDTFEDRFASKNIREDEALGYSHEKISITQIKVGTVFPNKNPDRFDKALPSV